MEGLDPRLSVPGCRTSVLDTGDEGQGLAGVRSMQRKGETLLGSTALGELASGKGKQPRPVEMRQRHAGSAPRPAPESWPGLLGAS